MNIIETIAILTGLAYCGLTGPAAIATISGSHFILRDGWAGIRELLTGEGTVRMIREHNQRERDRVAADWQRASVRAAEAIMAREQQQCTCCPLHSERRVSP